MRALLAALAVVVAGCQGTLTTSDVMIDSAVPDAANEVSGARSGERLKIRWTEFAGTRLANGLYDSLRKEDCSPVEWFGGAWSCTPQTGGTITYSDAGCTQRVGRVYRDPDCTMAPPPSYFVEYGQVGCTSRTAKIFERGTKLAINQYYTRASDGTCNGPFATTTYDYYRLGTEVPQSALAPITMSEPEGTGRIAQRYYESNDGMRMPARAYDTQIGTDCTMSYEGYAATTAQCQPVGSVYASYFSDAQCTTPQVSQYDQCTPPAFARHSPDNCPSSPETFYRIGAQTSGSPLYYKSSTACTSTTPSSTSRYYAVGEQLQVATLPRTAERSETRISTIYYESGDTRIRDTRFYDHARQTECYAYELADGTLRCIPSATYIYRYFTDAACTNAIDIAEIYRGRAECPTPPIGTYAIKYLPPPPGQCTGNYEIHTIGELYTGPLYDDFGGCTRYTPTAFVPYAVGPIVPLDQFASGTRVVD